MSKFSGYLLSPIILESLGYYGNYLINLSAYICALVYLIFCVKEPIVKKEPKQLKTCLAFIDNFAVQPVTSMFKTLIKKRPGNLRLLLILQIFLYGILWMNCQWEYGMEYLYMLKVYENATETNYAYYTAVKSLSTSFIMLVILPRLHIHESLYIILGLSSQAVAYFILPWAATLWQFYLVQCLAIVYYGAWASARTLFTYCVDDDEIGKIYASVGIIASIAPLIANPLFRQLYKEVLILPLYMCCKYSLSQIVLPQSNYLDGLGLSGDLFYSNYTPQ
jgi:hypothetical protein